jgi:hypothetical protein
MVQTARSSRLSLSNSNEHHESKEKMERSKYTAPAYSISNALRQEDAISSTFGGLLDWIDRYTESQNPMHLDKYLTYATFDVVGELIFSKPFGFLQQGKDIGDAISNSLALNAFLAVAGYIRWIFVALVENPFMTWLGILPMGHLLNTTMKAVHEREQNQDARYDVVVHWFKQHREHPEPISIRDIYAQATGAVGAGSDTVSGAMQSFVYHLIRNPIALDKARSEIDATIKEKGICKDRVVSYADAQQLPYVQACIKEAMRVFGPVPMGLPRVAPATGVFYNRRQNFPGRYYPVCEPMGHPPFEGVMGTRCWGIQPGPLVQR